MMLKAFIYNFFVPKFIKEYRRNKRTHIYPIIKDPLSKFSVLCRVKEGSWDEMLYPPLYGRTREQYMKVFTEPQYAYDIPNALINCSSDVVLTDSGAYWDKFNEEEFYTWAKPGDVNVLDYNKETIKILLSPNRVYLSGIVLSLVGVYCYHWEHFLAQFACKMYYAGENGLLNKELTILYYDRGDSCIKQFIDDYIADFPKVKILKAENNIDYMCERLIAIPSTTPNFNDYKFRLDFPYVIPTSVVERIDKYVVNYYIEKIRHRNCPNKKIFLSRAEMRRTLTNYDEIHNYFKSMGFVDIEGSTLTLEDKADIFYHAKEIVGIFGGGNQNMMFCNGARCLILTNYRMSTLAWGLTQMKNKLSCWINVAGQDESSDYHSNFTIPLEKVKKAYDEYIRTDK